MNIISANFVQNEEFFMQRFEALIKQVCVLVFFTTHTGHSAQNAELSGAQILEMSAELSSLTFW